MRSEILEKRPEAKTQVEAVWFRNLWTDARFLWPSGALDDPRVVNFWDADQTAGECTRLISRSAGKARSGTLGSSTRRVRPSPILRRRGATQSWARASAYEPPSRNCNRHSPVRARGSSPPKYLLQALASQYIRLGRNTFQPSRSPTKVPQSPFISPDGRRELLRFCLTNLISRKERCPSPRLNRIPHRWHKPKPNRSMSEMTLLTSVDFPGRPAFLRRKTRGDRRSRSTCSLASGRFHYPPVRPRM